MSKIVNVVSEVIEVLSNRMGEKLPLLPSPQGR